MRVQKASNSNILHGEFIETLSAGGTITVDGKAVKPATFRQHYCWVRIGAEIFVFTDVIQSRTFGVTFAKAVRVTSDKGAIEIRKGKAARYVLKLKPGDMSLAADVIWEGSIELTGNYRAWVIAPDRTLSAPDWTEYWHIRVTNYSGNVIEHDIAAMDFQQAGGRAYWPDRLGIFSRTNRLGDVKTYIMILSRNYGEGSTMIQGQGPIYLDSERTAFISGSYIFDDSGNMRTDITADLTSIPQSCNYYDLTPVSEITEQEIGDGCRALIDGYRLTPDYPEIPAAYMGQLGTAALVAIQPELAVHTLQPGLKGSGKSYDARRYDIIQSRTMRNVKRIKPVINLGDVSGTRKGPKYRAREFGGFAITVDDVIKSGMSAAKMADQSDTVSDLLRSLENGGASLARVDHGQNRVVAAETPQLFSSIRCTAEKAITGESTLDRMIILPFLTHEWGKPGGAFDTNSAERLCKPESLELQHRAYSAYVHWLFSNPDTLADLYDKAKVMVEGWHIGGRSDKYIAAVTGNLMLAQFCEMHGAPPGPALSRALEALQLCAARQANSSMPLAERFREAVRMLAINGRAAFPGPPSFSPDGSPSGSYSEPWRLIEGEPGEDGIPARIQEMPTANGESIDFQSLGLTIENGNPKPNGRATVYGYVVPPRESKGGPGGNDLTRGWVIACKREQFEALCETLSRDTILYHPGDVLQALRTDSVGDSTRVYISGKQQRAVIINIGWLYTRDEDNE